MKTFLLVLASLGLSLFSYGQHVYQIRADSVRIYNTCDTAELILENRTQHVPGFLYNKGRGRTEFRRLTLNNLGNGLISLGDQDTLDLGASGQNIYNTDGWLSGNRKLSGTNNYYNLTFDSLGVFNIGNKAAFNIKAGKLLTEPNENSSTLNISNASIDLVSFPAESTMGSGMKIYKGDSSISISSTDAGNDGSGFRNRELFARKGNVYLGAIGAMPGSGGYPAAAADSNYKVVEAGISRAGVAVDTGLIIKYDKPSNKLKSYKLTFAHPTEIYPFGRPAIWAESSSPGMLPTLVLSGASGISIIGQGGSPQPMLALRQTPTGPLIGALKGDATTGNFTMSSEGAGTLTLSSLNGDAVLIANRNIVISPDLNKRNPAATGTLNGKWKLADYKNNAASDSLLTTDSNGNLKLVHKNATGPAFTAGKTGRIEIPDTGPAEGKILIPHGLGAVPSSINIMCTHVSSEINLQWINAGYSADATNIIITYVNNGAPTAIAGLYWQAFR